MTTTDNRTLLASLVSKEAKRQKRTERRIRALVAFVFNSLLALWGGWMLMLAVGVAHAHWINALPTIGYWWAVLLVYLLRGSFVVIKSKDLEDKS